MVNTNEVFYSTAKPIYNLTVWIPQLYRPINLWQLILPNRGLQSTDFAMAMYGQFALTYPVTHGEQDFP